MRTRRAASALRNHRIDQPRVDDEQLEHEGISSPSWPRPINTALRQGKSPSLVSLYLLFMSFAV